MAQHGKDDYGGSGEIGEGGEEMSTASERPLVKLGIQRFGEIRIR